MSRAVEALRASFLSKAAIRSSAASRVEEMHLMQDWEWDVESANWDEQAHCILAYRQLIKKKNSRKRCKAVHCDFREGIKLLIQLCEQYLSLVSKSGVQRRRSYLQSVEHKNRCVIVVVEQ